MLRTAQKVLYLYRLPELDIQDEQLLDAVL